MIAPFESFPKRKARSFLNASDAIHRVGASSVQAYLQDTAPWFWINQQAAVLKVTNGVLTMDNASTVNQLCVLGRWLQPSTHRWCYRAQVHHGSSTGANGALSGLALYESATGKYYALYGGTNPGALIQSARWTNATTFGANYGAVTVTPPAAGIITSFLELEYDGTNYVSRYGFYNDFGMVQQTSQAATTPFTTRADAIGFVVHAPSGVTTLSIKRFWRLF